MLLTYLPLVAPCFFVHEMSIDCPETMLSLQPGLSDNAVQSTGGDLYEVVLGVSA